MLKILKNIKQLINSNIYYITGLLCMFFIFALNLYKLLKKLQINDINGYKYYLFFCIIVLVLSLIVFLVIMKYNDKKIADFPKFFVISCTIIGVVFIFLSPLFTGSDEHNHYYRIYEISEGKLTTPVSNSVGGFLPKSLETTFLKAGADNTKIKYKNIKNMYKVKLNKRYKKKYGEFTQIKD